MHPPMRCAASGPCESSAKICRVWAGQQGWCASTAAVAADIEADARLAQDADLPAVQIVERLDEVLRAPAPLVELELSLFQERSQ